MTEISYSALVVTKDNKITPQIKAMLIPPVFEVQFSADYNRARRECAEKSYDIVIVDFADGEGTDFAIDISDSASTVLLIVPSEHFEQISYKVECYGILTMPYPVNQFYFYNMIKVAIAVHCKIRSISSQTIKLKEKMEEIRITNRAKMLLMQHFNLSEEDAHYKIEKDSMDKCTKKIIIAKEIIQQYSC